MTPGSFLIARRIPLGQAVSVCRPVARLLSAAVILAMLPQGVLDQIGVAKQPPQSDVLLVQQDEFLGGVGPSRHTRDARRYGG